MVDEEIVDRPGDGDEVVGPAEEEGQIGRVEITGSDTFYPQSYIDGLPAKVVNAPVVASASRTVSLSETKRFPPPSIAIAHGQWL